MMINYQQIVPKLKSACGFSLAEVLITLAVIGVTAAIGIPAIINSTSNRENVVALKKYASVLNSSFQLYLANNNCPGGIHICKTFTTESDFFTIFGSSLNIAKDCNTAGHGCFPANVNYKYLNPTLNWEVIDDDTSMYKVQLIDGASMMTNVHNGACTLDNSKTHSDPLTHSCGELYIDVNGEKGPNQVGRDLFMFIMTRTGIYPAGIPDDIYHSLANNLPACEIP